MLDFEAALARAQARLGVIPAAAAPAIAARAEAELFDVAAIGRAAARAGNPAIPLVRRLTALVAEHDEPAARFVHWGATSQDAMDTGLVLQLRAFLGPLEADLGRLAAGLARLAEEHRDTAMVGRTWLQQALPTTFGLKAAGWLDAVGRHRQRLAELRPRLLVVQLGGAAGTLASLGGRGLEVADALAGELGLAAPALPWHGARDRVAELAAWLGLLVGTLGKVARDWSLMTQTEVGEVLEPAGEGRGGSSTMPHKRNPVAAAAVLAAAVRAPGLVATMLSAMVQEHERGLGGWHAEWETLPELAVLAAGALRQAAETVEGLEVDRGRMRANLGLTRGLIMAEAVQMALGGEARPAAGARAGRAGLQARGGGRAGARRRPGRGRHGRAAPGAGRAGTAARPFHLSRRGGRVRRPGAGGGARQPGGSLMPFVEAEGARLHYQLEGREDAPVLMLSNSLGTALGMWDPQARAFAMRHRLLRYDSRGHGRSAVPPGPYTIERLGRDALAILDALGLRAGRVLRPLARAAWSASGWAPTRRTGSGGWCSPTPRPASARPRSGTSGSRPSAPWAWGRSCRA